MNVVHHLCLSLSRFVSHPLSFCVYRRLLVPYTPSSYAEAQTGVSGQDVSLRSGRKWYISYVCIGARDMMPYIMQHALG